MKLRELIESLESFTTRHIEAGDWDIVTETSEMEHIQFDSVEKIVVICTSGTRCFWCGAVDCKCEVGNSAPTLKVVK